MSNSVGEGKLMYLASTQAVLQDVGVYVFPFDNPVTTDWDVSQRDRVTVSLRSATIPVTWTVVTEETNTLVVRLTETGQLFVIRLPVGSPSASQWGNSLRSFFENNSATGFSSGYDKTRMQFFFTSGVSGVPIEVGVEGTTCAAHLGLTAPIVFTSSDINRTLYTQNVVDLTGPRHVMVTINLPMESTDSSRRTRGTLAAIPVDECKGSMLQYEPATPFRLATSFDQIQQLVVELTDESYEPLDLRGGRWAMVLQFN